MEDLRYVHIADPRVFLEATKDFDDSFMNFSIGTITDYLARRRPDQEDEPDAFYFSTISKGEQLLLVLGKTKFDYYWQLLFPCTAQDHFAADPALLPAALVLMATSTLARLQDPSKIDRMIGTADLLDPFFNTWCALALREHNLRARVSPGTFSLHIGYCTRASLAPLPPPEHPSHMHETRQATSDDVDLIAQLYSGFQLEQWQRDIPHADAVKDLLPAIEGGLLYYCCVDGKPAAFLLLGRSTPRTIAVMNVYVALEHRRKGMAGAIVRAATRYYLGGRPHGVSGVVPETPLVGLKEEVGLNVQKDEAERVYQRAGYMFPDRTRDDPTGGFDPVSGRNAWLKSVTRVLVYEPETQSTGHKPRSESVFVAKSVSVL